MRKRNLFTIAIVVCFLIFALLMFTKPAKVDLGESNLYSPEEIQAAADAVIEKFEDFKGCRLFKVAYAGDLESLAKNGYSSEYDEAVVMKAVFLSPLRAESGWDPHEVYTWWFTLKRTDHGPWELQTWGGG